MMAEMTIAAIEGTGRAWAGWLLGANGWALAVLALAVLCDATFARRVAPKWRMALYALVFVRVVVPEGWSTPWSLVPGAPASASAVGPVVATPAIHTSTPIAGAVHAASGAAGASMSWGTMVLLLHGLVALALFAVGVRRYRAFAEIRRASRPVELGADVCTRVHPTAGPLAMGIRSPVVVLPAAALELPCAELAAIVGHERAHLRHRDPVLQAALIVACALLWPVLPVWLAAARLRTLMEIRADEAVTRALDPRATRRYGELLLRVASQGLHGAPALGLGAAELGARLKALRHRRTTSTLAQACAVALAAATSATLVARRTGDAPAGPNAIDRAAPAVAEPAEVCPLDRPWRSPGTPAAAQAEARFATAQARVEAGDLQGAIYELEEAAWQAAASRYDDLAAVAVVELVGVHASLGDTDQALAWARHADAAFRRAGPLRPELAFRTLRADLLARSGDTEAAAREQSRVEQLEAMAAACER